MSIAEDGGFEILNQAAILTLSLFSGLSAIVLLTKKDFSFLRSGLAIGFFIALGLIIAGTLFGFNLGLWFSAGMVVLADGTERAKRCLERVLHNDPALGIFRHSDAGYEEATENLTKFNLHI